MDIEKKPRKPNRRSIYKESFEYAVQHNETIQYHRSDELNRECAAAIDKAISDNQKDAHHIDVPTALETVCADFGKNRLTWVVAANVKSKDFDGRISSRNKEWAREIPVPIKSTNYYGYALSTHATVIDSIADRIRQGKVIARKPSVLDEIKDNKQEIAAKIQEKPQEKSVTKLKKRVEMEV